jgi:molecular chaperone DnaK
MVRDAESHRAEDAQLREAIDVRNQIDALTYQIEKTVRDLGEAVPVHEKARADMLVADARQALKEEAPVDRMRSLVSELQQVLQSISASGRPAGPGPNGGHTGSGSPGADGPGGDDDVIDAEFTTG